MTDIQRVATRYGSGRTSVTARHRQIPLVTHELVYNVAVDDPAIGTLSVAADGRVVQLGDVYADGLDYDPTSVCVDVDDRTGLARHVAPLRLGGVLEEAVPGFWD